MKKVKLLALLLAVLALAALIIWRVGSGSDQRVDVSAAWPDRTRDLKSFAAEEEPLPLGAPVTVDGVPLPGGSLVIADQLYTSLNEFGEILGLGLKEKAGMFGFTWRGQRVSGQTESARLRVGDEERELSGPAFGYRGELYVPMESFCEQLGISVFHDEEFDRWYCTPSAGSWVLPEGHKVPVLMYHAVSNDVWGIEGLFVRPEYMDQQLQYLLENGYEPIWFEDLEHVEQYSKPIILTFDDGYKDNYTDLFPLLEKYQVKATIFLITDYLGADLYLNTDMVTEMVQSGLVSFQSHTATHPAMNTLSYEKQKEEMERSKLSVTRLTGKEPFVVCYPMGKTNADTLTLAGDVYRFGVMMGGPAYVTGSDPVLVYRYGISRDLTLDGFSRMFP